VSDLYEAPMSRDSITRAMQNLPPHLCELLTAVRDNRVAFLFVPQWATTFRIPKQPVRPAIVLIGDDFTSALGPGHFHAASLRRVIRACASFTVVAGSARPEIYGAAADLVVASRKSALLVETRPEHEIQWVQLIQRYAPGRPICLSTVAGGHA
jgi:hypothetical protein